MKSPLAKMHGAGNDFVVLAQAPPDPPGDAPLVRALADRRRGIGADGVLFLDRDVVEPDRFRMHFYNSDGGRVQLCLNGARCVALRARQLGWVESERFSFATEAQRVEARILDYAGDRATVQLWLAGPRSQPTSLSLPAASPAATAWHVDTGDPHLVLEVSDRDLESDFVQRARLLRHWTEVLSEGANVHFVCRSTEDSWSIRSFERGVEDETQACGSGCLSAVAALAAPGSGEISLKTRHGDVLRVAPPPEAGAPWRLSGPAVCVFQCERAELDV
jgi:diaminopimelate epimerase